jgi:serine phosphatase RsbU (regulator of sigma subunit)
MIRPCKGERRSGDATLVAERVDGYLCAIVDGLGHGFRAHAAAVRAVDFLRDADSANLISLLEKLDVELRGTVGAAVGIAHVDVETGSLRYSGIGNTVIRRFGSDETRLVSRGGVIGGQMRTPKEESMTLQSGDVVLMYSDGVSDRVDAETYREILGHGIDVVAGQVVRRFGKDHDDAGCVALRYRA